MSSNLSDTNPYPPQSSMVQDLDPEGGPQPQNQPASKGGGKCLLYGCLGIVLGTVLLMICGGYATYSFYQRQLTKFTDETPIEMPETSYSEEQLGKLKERIEGFRTALVPVTPEDTTDENASEENNAEKGPPPTENNLTDQQRELVLTADDLNALISMEEKLKGKLFVKIDGDTITGDVSVPLEGLIPGAQGRYFNGSGTFDVQLENGILIVTLEEASVKGEPLPPQFIEGFRQQNLAKDYQLTPEGAEFIGQFERINVEEGQVVLTLKSPEDASEDEQQPNSDQLETPPASAPEDATETEPLSTPPSS